MATITEYKEFVKAIGYGSSQYNNINGEKVYLSRGIKEAYLENEETEQKIIAMVSRFQKADYGNAAEYGKDSKEGHEYGRYDTDLFEDDGEDNGVWIHRTEDAIKVYFKFER